MQGVDEEKIPQQKNPKKGVVFGVFFLALFAAIFGIFQIRKNLYPDLAWANPFKSTARQNDTPPISSALTDALALQAKDTDGDGLSDYDEMNRYKTSPYLKDTDSDGIDDKAEITQGTDPNCPKGQDCAPVVTAKNGEILPNPPFGKEGDLFPFVKGGTEGGFATTSSPQSKQGVVTGQAPPFTPENARALLRKGGLTEEQIAQFDDATLRQMYEESVQKIATTPTVPSSAQQYTPAQIRELLKANGVSEELLQSVDDATIMQIFTEAISKQGQAQ
ncbi:hypothetical protein HY625_03415 [Candidatus Uhrbacteria bacterium]|nr:hypothetical protein [Candidatus Uhrbacteria bacterium]